MEVIKAEIIAALKELKEAIKPKAVVFDLDGTLIDSSERYSRCIREAKGDKKKFWECFLSEKYMELDRPREEVVKLLRGYLVKKYKIIIITGRIRQTQERKTKEQLRKWGIYYHEIIFREKGDYRKDYVLKLEYISKLMDCYKIEAIYDDSDHVIEAIKNRFPSIKVRKV